MDLVFCTDELDFVSEPIEVRKFFSECVSAQQALADLLTDMMDAGMRGTNGETAEEMERIIELLRDELAKRENHVYRQMGIRSCPYYKYNINALLTRYNDESIRQLPYIPEDVELEVFFLRPHNKAPPFWEQQLRQVIICLCWMFVYSPDLLDRVSYLLLV
ncbi:unnamed protein product [Soboliphyme baturini]|uniref:Dynein heavy chain 7, axonemal n=1 Tax=Soboliphyme baturini TaxID=241478 RepID=A0A183IA44_9BILA|nr:unnamed protein product [Soboliphyme baturini]